MSKQISNTQAEDIYAGLEELIRKEMLVDIQWLSRVTASPSTVFELLLESTRNERCPKIRSRYQEIGIEEQLESYLLTYKYMEEQERAKLSYTITYNKLFLVP
jgi:hypothetical protein